MPGLWTLLLCAGVDWCRANSRIDLVDEQIRSTEEVLASLEAEEEKQAYQKKLELLRREKEIIQRRLDLREKEKSLTGNFRKSAKLRLRDFLHTVSAEAPTLESELADVLRDIKKAVADRAALETQAEALREREDGDTELVVNTEMRLDVLIEEIRAMRLKETRLEFELRLVQEADRIRQRMQDMPINPKPATRNILDLRRYIDGQSRLLGDVGILLANLEEQKREVTLSLELSQAQRASLDEEISLLESKLSGINRLLQKNQLLTRAKSHRRLIDDKIEAETSQLDSLQRAMATLKSTEELYRLQQEFLREYGELQWDRYMRRILAPITAIVVIFLLYLLLSRVVFPVFFKRDELFNARRLSGYVVGLVCIVVISIYFLDDLQAIATVFGIAGAALVIALQDLLTSVAGWFVIVSSRKVRVGDRVEVDKRRGDIIDIQLLRTTMVELNEWLGVDHPTGRIVILPNSYIFKTSVVNYSNIHKFLWGDIDVLITFESSVETAKRVLMTILEEECADTFASAAGAARVMEQKYGVSHSSYEPKIYVSVEDSGVMFKLLYISHYKQFSATRSRISDRIARAFEETDGIEFAYPTERHIPTPEKQGFQVKLNSGD